MQKKDENVFSVNKYNAVKEKLKCWIMIGKEINMDVFPNVFATSHNEVTVTKFSSK